MDTDGASSREGWFAELDSAFDRVLHPWRNSERPFTLLFSGGVDSGLLAWELRKAPSIELLAVGLADSPDLAQAQSAADRLGLRLTSRVVPPADVREAETRLRAERTIQGRTARSVLTSLAVAIERASHRSVLCGQGADELFLGYAHFRSLSREELASRAELDLRILVERDWPASVDIAEQRTHTLVAPYLDSGFRDAARRVPLEARAPDPQPKAFFRAWARHRGLCPEVADRPKKALQFGTGFDRLLRAERPPPSAPR